MVYPVDKLIVEIYLSIATFIIVAFAIINLPNKIKHGNNRNY